MASMIRHKTKYPGVTYHEVMIDNTSRAERVYYIRYRKDGRNIEEKAGGHIRNDMTPAKASRIRASRIDGASPSNNEHRIRLKAEREARENRWTIDKLWAAYSELKEQNTNHQKDRNRYINHIAPAFGNKEPKDLLPLDVDRLRINLRKKRSAQTTKHVLTLLKRIINFGVKKELCSPLHFVMEMPSVNNTKDDALTMGQISALWNAADEDDHPQAGDIIKLALLTGMRRGELFKLKWADVNFETKFITLRSPKNGQNQQIPLNSKAESVLVSHAKTESEFVFPGRNGRQRTTAQKPINKIKQRAGLPDDIRPLHSLRHTFATLVLNTGRVDLYTLQRLTTHKGPEMVQRYAHLRDAKLHDASNVVSEEIEALTQCVPKQAAKKLSGK